MSEFKQDEEVTPVMFRIGRSKKEAAYGVTAVFPCEPADYGGTLMACYAHVGQHGSCDWGWLMTTRAAKPEEYADLKAELEGAPYGYRLKVYKRHTAGLRNRYRLNARALVRL